MRHLMGLFVLMLLTCNQALAGGFLGDIVRAVPVPGAKQLGDGMDDANRRAKEALPPYKKLEEGASGVVRRGFNELNGEVDGPILAQWIRASRNDVINAGVGPMPPQIYQGLVGFFAPQVLQRVRYRSGWGNELALPALSFEFGDVAAITLGTDIIMFRNESDAQNNLSLWAHELTHTLQYERWDTLDFAKRYVKDHNGVEGEAIANASRFDQWYRSGGAQTAQVPNNGPALGNFCITPIGRFGPGPANPLRSPCNITSPQGLIWGEVGL
jgi:hypothetical protein